jgi:hypothetical protein
MDQLTSKLVSPESLLGNRATKVALPLQEITLGPTPSCSWNHFDVIKNKLPIFRSITFFVYIGVCQASCYFPSCILFKLPCSAMTWATHRDATTALTCLGLASIPSLPSLPNPCVPSCCQFTLFLCHLFLLMFDTSFILACRAPCSWTHAITT